MFIQLKHINQLKKMTGIELIAKERQEQIEKHGFDAEHDANIFHKEGELLQAALFAIKPNNIMINWPEDWDLKKRDKIKSKSKIDRLVIAGALIAAEIDRLNKLNP